ncbi:MAG: hypothetical protein LBR21_05135 [Propionibacteriaceae bacterium]|jgi:hypothetical protein|nr:hypothetical protein [Propionibacteriaceae bacterium]
MNVPQAFGRHIYHSEPQKGHQVGIVVLLVFAIVFSLFLLLIGAVCLSDPESFSFGVLLLVAAVFLLALAIFGFTQKGHRRYVIDVFEHGMVLTEEAGKKSLVYHYDDLEGIQCGEFQARPDLSRLAEDLFEKPQNTMLVSRWISIFPRGGKRMGLKIPRMAEAAPLLENAYTQHVLSTLTRENIRTRTIRFGRYVSLTGGRFVHSRLGKQIPLETVIGFSPEDTPHALVGMFDSIPLAELRDPDAMNRRLLLHIVAGVSRG